MKAAALASGLATLRQKGHTLGHDFVLATFLAVFRLPPALLQTPVDDHPVALAQVLPAMFGLFAEDDDVDEADFFLQLLALLEATGVPLGVYRSSGFRVRFPTRITLLNPANGGSLCGWCGHGGASGRSRLLLQFHREELDDGVFKPIGAF